MSIYTPTKTFRLETSEHTETHPHPQQHTQSEGETGTSKMSTRVFIIFAIMLLGSSGSLRFGALPVAGDVRIGNATSYYPPYNRTKCNSSNQEQFPENGMFVAASKGIWAGGAACGQKFLISCLNGLNDPCKNNETVLVEVVDLCRTNPCPTFLLSTKAFDAISKFANATINVEYAQN